MKIERLMEVVLVYVLIPNSNEDCSLLKPIVPWLNLAPAEKDWYRIKTLYPDFFFCLTKKSIQASAILWEKNFYFFQS